MAATRNTDQWVCYNPLTQTYDTKDGTAIAAERVESARCLADVLSIAQSRQEQRALKQATVTPGVSHE